MVKSVGMNEVARKAYENIQRAVKKEVITEEKLVGQPAKELFEKAKYMTIEEFWRDPHNAAQYAKGLYLASNPSSGKHGIETIYEKGKPVAVIDSWEILPGHKGFDVAVTDKLNNIRTFFGDTRMHVNPKFRREIKVDEYVMDMKTGKHYKCRELTEGEKRLREIRFQALDDWD